MKIILFPVVFLSVFLSGCMWFLPEGEAPANPAGESGVSRLITPETAESSMAVSLTQTAVRLGITPMRYYPMPNISGSFLRSLDPNLFHRTDERSYDYLLVSSRSGDSWTLSLKRKKSDDFIWSKTITKIRKN